MKKKISKRMILNLLVIIVGLGTIILDSSIVLDVNTIEIIAIFVAGANMILQKYFNQDKNIKADENKTIL